jgi:hypothetical protein
MDTVPVTQQSLAIDQGSLLAFVRTMIDGDREDDEHPLPPGPWDPVVRIALERISVFGPSPEPWALASGQHTWQVIFQAILKAHPEIWDVVGGGHHLAGHVHRPPAPPRYGAMIAIAQTVIARVELIHEIAVMANRGGGDQAGPDAGAYLARFADDFCGSEVRLKWPFPGPRPKWFDAAIDGIDLAIMATQFDRAAKHTFDANLREQLEGVAGKLAEAGLAKMA